MVDRNGRSAVDPKIANYPVFPLGETCSEIHVFFRRRTGLCSGRPVGSYLDREDGLHPGSAGGIVTIVLKRLHPRLPISLRLPFGEGLGTWCRLHQRPYISLRLPFGKALGIGIACINAPRFRGGCRLGKRVGLHSGFIVALSE